MAVHEAAVGGRRAESQTFEVRRAAYSDHLSTLAIKMLAVSMNYAGAEARFPRDNTNNDRRCIEATLSRSIDIRRNARALNGFRRRDVYKELELTVPELSSRMDDVKVEYADVIGNNRAGHFVVLGFDEGSEERLNEQRNGIGEAVARAAGIGIERLQWPDFTHNIVMGFVKPSESTDAVAEMYSLAADAVKDPFTVDLGQARLLPRQP